MFGIQEKQFDAYFYRIEDKLVSGGCDEWDNEYPAVVHNSLRKFGVLKYTKKGAWIEVAEWVVDNTCEDGGHYRTKRFILLTANKRYACPTIKEAKESFIARKERQKSILYHKIDNIDIAIDKLYLIKDEQ